MTIKRKEMFTGIMLVTPFMIGFITFFLLPFFISVSYTFTFGAGGRQFVGIRNYQDVLSSDAFQRACYNTLRFILIGVPLIMLGSMIIALLLKRTILGGAYFRSVFIYPMIVPVASVVMVFQVFFANTGIINTLLGFMGMPASNWINSDKAFGVLVFLYIWKNTGYNVILLLSGLNGIPDDFYEAASIEGANKWYSFRRITMPIMSPTFFFVFVISVVNSFKSFREAFLLSGTIPHKSIYMLQHFMNNNFSNLNYQRLSVAAICTFAIIFVLIYAMFYLRRKAGDVQI